VSVDEIQDIEVLRKLVKMQLQESARLKLQLAEALSKLQDKSGADAEQLALKLDKIEKQHAAALKQLFGPKSERGPLARAGKNGSSPKTGHGPKEQQKLPIEEVVHELDPDEAFCELCNARLGEWVGQIEEAPGGRFRRTVGDLQKAPAREVPLHVRRVHKNRTKARKAVYEGSIQH
jgi:hypothetical protein